MSTTTERASAETAVAAPAQSASACGFTTCRISRQVITNWASCTLKLRLRVLRDARHRMAAQAEEFAAAISPQLARSKADTLAAEVLPLLDAIQFLERNAERVLAPRRLGRNGRPWWLMGVVAEVRREALGHVLIIGPANFPLFVPGIQAVQALAAGNTVTWKPGRGGAGVAALVARALEAAGLPAGVLTITDESVEAAHEALAARPDKVIFTGSESSGRAVLATLAASGTPAIAELSGADAVLVTPGADLARVAKAVAFGLRLNGGAVCMSPRRLFASQASMHALLPLLEAELAKVPAVALDGATAGRLQAMLFEAMTAGARVHGEFTPSAQRPLVISGATPQMAIARSDVFAPVISLIVGQSELHGLSMYAECPYALTAAIFCGRHEEKKVLAMAAMLKAGTVLINDVIAPTADPRVPFGGRGASGYGVTRGAEGLLELTAVKTILVRRGRSTLHMDPVTDDDVPLVAGAITALHGKGFAMRWAGVKRLVQAARQRVAGK